MLVHLFYRCLVQTYLLFSNLIKLTFHHWHLLYTNPSPPGKYAANTVLRNWAMSLRFLPILKKAELA